MDDRVQVFVTQHRRINVKQSWNLRVRDSFTAGDVTWLAGEFPEMHRVPCGSGKKYKHCCWKKGFDYEEDDAGSVFKSIPLDDEMIDVLEEQRRRFIEKFGREPGPGDPIFFDMPHPEHLEHMTVEAMKKAGMDPAFIYAHEKTGRIVTEDNMHLLSDQDLAEWDAAIEEFEVARRRQPRKFPWAPSPSTAPTTRSPPRSPPASSGTRMRRRSSSGGSAPT
jgi:hypothetical protein